MHEISTFIMQISSSVKNIEIFRMKSSVHTVLHSPPQIFDLAVAFLLFFFQVPQSSVFQISRTQFFQVSQNSVFLVSLVDKN
jgi:hypothetical protein